MTMLTSQVKKTIDDLIEPEQIPTEIGDNLDMHLNTSFIAGPDIPHSHLVENSTWFEFEDDSIGYFKKYDNGLCLRSNVCPREERVINGVTYRFW